MAVLTAAKRRTLPNSEFGEPGEGKYPMADWQHAANAKSRAKQMLRRGKLSRDAYEKIVAKANEVMRRSR